jgi:hypothetical protein
MSTKRRAATAIGADADAALSPLERWRSRSGIYVSDFSSQAWCERKFELSRQHRTRATFPALFFCDAFQLTLACYST